MLPKSLTLVSIIAFSLTACGSSSEEPTEQIIVNKPGQTTAVVNNEETPSSDLTTDDLVTRGKSAFAVCAACHKIGKDEASTVGPNLYGVVGRAAGSVDGFDYSDAIKASDITWNEAELDAFIANPAAKIAGTYMSAGAVRDDEKRKTIIAYLASLSE